VNKFVIILCMNVHYSTVYQILVDRLTIWWLGYSPFHCLMCTLNQSEATSSLDNVQANLIETGSDAHILMHVLKECI
jgi:hypothetical protein